MKNHYFLLPIGLLATILSCLTTYLYSLIIGLGILMIAISKKKHTTLSILVFILWIILINYYISTQKNQRLSIINQYPTSKQTQFIGTLTYHHKNKVIITIKNLSFLIIFSSPLIRIFIERTNLKQIPVQ